MIELYHNDMSSCAQKVRFVLHEKGLDWKSIELDLRAGEQLKPEFLKINPRGLVPVLVHDGAVIPESTIICEYLDEAFPEPPLLPKTPLARAQTRLWTQPIDEFLHMDTVALSFAIAFGEQLRSAQDTAEKLEVHLKSIPDLEIREIQRQVVPHGVHCDRFALAITRYANQFALMDEVLGTQPWLAGERLSLADIEYGPYATRAEHLRLEALWEHLPNFTRWYEHLKKTEGYQKGFAEWFNPNYLELMGSKGLAAQSRVREILAN